MSGSAFIDVLPPAADRGEWAGRVRAAWGGALEAVLATGRALIEAKAALDHGDFAGMIEADLPFEPRTAQRLMAVAADPRLANPTHASLLPPSWATLYELTRLDDDAFAAALADGRIRTDMERKDAERLRTAERRSERLARTEALAAASEPLPAAAAGRRYPVIYADPPWEFATHSERGQEKAAGNHYPTMTAEAIAALAVGALAADDSALFLWATVPHLETALVAMAAWGFAYRSHVVWRKTTADGSLHRGTGFWFVNAHELLLLGVRGDLPAPLMGTQDESVIDAPVGRHSEKPAVFRHLIERYFPGVGRIELFARAAAPGWDAWGNEAGPAADAGAGFKPAPTAGAAA